MTSSKVPFAQHRADVHDDRPIDDIGHHGQVVLHQEHGRVPLALHGAQHRRHLRRLVQVEPRGRLVGEQDLRFGREGPGQLDQATVPEAERVHRHVGQARDPDEVQRGLHPLHLVLCRLAQVEEVPPQTAFTAARPLCDHEVVAHRHVGEHLHLLVGAADAEAGALVRRQSAQRACRRNRCPPHPARNCPQTQLNKVVLPAPLGPTRPTLSPGATSNVMLCTAWIPPKDLQTPRRLRSGSTSAIGARRSTWRA